MPSSSVITQERGYCEGAQALPCDDGGVASFAQIAIPTGIETASKLKFPYRNQDITIHRAENVGTAVMCPNEATTSTWLNSQRSEKRTQEDTMNQASEGR
jgi:hypothetical protein